MTEFTAPADPSAEIPECYEDTKTGGWEHSVVREANAALLPTTLARFFQTKAIA